MVQLRPTLCDPVDCSLSGSSIHGILQARILEWAAISSSRDWNFVSCFSCIGNMNIDSILHHWATWEACALCYAFPTNLELLFHRAPLLMHVSSAWQKNSRQQELWFLVTNGAPRTNHIIGSIISRHSVNIFWVNQSMKRGLFYVRTETKRQEVRVTQQRSCIARLDHAGCSPVPSWRK